MRIHADMREDAEVPMLLRRLDDHDLRGADIKQRAASHADALAGIGGAADHVFAVAERGHLAGQGLRLRIDAELGQRHLVADRQRHRGADAGGDQRGHRLWIADRPDRDAGQALCQRFVQHGHVVASAAGHAVVAVVEQ